jgi:hypothetical protein
VVCRGGIWSFNTSGRNGGTVLLCWRRLAPVGSDRQ